MGTMELPLNW
jgi:ABC-type Mn2+/Zn2+ transport system ATPase subunit